MLLKDCKAIEVKLRVDPANMGWHEVPVVADSLRCSHDTEMCELCRYEWDQDWHVRLIQKPEPEYPRDHPVARFKRMIPTLEAFARALGRKER